MSEHFEAMNKPAPENTYFWSRSPGKFVNKRTGQEGPVYKTKQNELVMVSELVVSATPKTVVRVFQEKEVEVPNKGPMFFGNVREWYETLIETIIDASNTLFKRHLQVPTILEVGPDLLTILEHTVAYKPNYYLDGRKPETLPMTRGEFVGELSNRFKIVKCVNMPHDEIKVVLLTEFKNVVNYPDSESTTAKMADGTIVPVNVPKLPEICIQPLGSLQRLDEWTVKVLDMCLI